MSAEELEVELVFTQKEAVDNLTEVTAAADEATRAIDDFGTTSETASASADHMAQSVSDLGIAARESAAQAQYLADNLKSLDTLDNAKTMFAGLDQAQVRESATAMLEWQTHLHESTMQNIAQRRLAEKDRHNAEISELNNLKEIEIANSGKVSQALKERYSEENERHKKNIQSLSREAEVENLNHKAAKQNIMAVRSEERQAAEEKKKATEAQREIDRAAAEERRKAAQQEREARDAARAAERERYNQTEGLSNARYALYDVAAAWRMVGVAAGGTLAVMTATSAKFESAFTGVERTVEIPVEKMGQLREDLMALTAAIPESFPDLAEIATIGGQLDIAGESIVGFTENVAKFATMTDVTVENTAMSFGRIDQLANSGRGSFDEIASAVYSVGVHTVATESQIVKMSQELAATASLAGFTADEVIGLSGALASLGAAPERSRGAIERTFATITNAVSMGGEELVKFANIAGMTAVDFSDAWQKAPAEAFGALLHGLSTIDNINAALADLGLNNLRTADIFKRLSGNVEIFDKSMEIASDTWRDHSEFAEAYGMVADDLASKMKMLANDILSMVDALVNNKALGAFVDQLRNIANVAKNVISVLNGIPGVDILLGVGIPAVLGLVAAVALLRAGMLTLRASYFAMITASERLRRADAVATKSIFDMVRAMVSLNMTSQKTTGSTTAASGAITRMGASARNATAQLKGAAASLTTLNGAAAAGRGLLSLFGGVPGIALMGGMAALSFLGNEMGKASAQAEELKQSFAGVGDALSQDLGIYERTGEALTTLTYGHDGVLLAVDDQLTAQGQFYSVLTDVADALGLAAEATDTYTLAMGENTYAAIAEAITQNERLKEIFTESGGAAEDLGLTLDELVAALVSGDPTAYIDQLKDSLAELYVEQDRLNREVDGSDYSKNHDELVAVSNQIDILEDSISNLEAMWSVLNDQFSATAWGDLVNESFGLMNDEVDELEYNLANLSETMFGSEMAIANFEGAMFNLAQSMADNGAEFDVYSEAGRANMGALMQVVNVAAQSAGNDVNALASMLAQALAQLGGTGVAIGKSFAAQSQSIVNSMAASYGVAAPNVVQLSRAMEAQTLAAQRNTAANNGAGRGARNAGNGARSAAREIRTLTDYVKDLSSVMKSAFDFRWGLQKSVDGVADAFQKLQDMKTDAIERVEKAFDGLESSQQKVADLRNEIAKLQADLVGLSADKGTLEYQLQVARDYGDSLREQEILAKLQQLQEDTAGKTNDLGKATSDLAKAERDEVKAGQELSDAQRDLVRDLTGTTAGSREQRAAVLALVQSYQDQVAELANTNMSQQQLSAETEKLRQKFIEQMVQLGYSRAEADKYSQSFVDMKKIIEQIPRNITINADANPAMRAIQDFRAKNTNGKGASAPFSAPINAVGGNVSTPRNNMQDWLNRNPLNIKIVTNDKYIRGSIAGKTAIIGSLYYTGGYTGRGGKYDPAGVVHKGEYVFPKSQVNQSTGLPYLSALGALLTGHRSSLPVQSKSSAPNTMIVELSPTDRKLIQDSGTAIVTLDGRVLASSVNQQNVNVSGRGY